MSSYIYDPHKIRQKPNRYYQRKGQIIRCKYLDTHNPAITKEDASKYIAAVKTYFPHLFQPQPPPTPTEPVLYIKAFSGLILKERPKGSFIISNSEFQNIWDETDGNILMITKNRTVPNTLTPQQAHGYSWFYTDTSQTNKDFPIQLIYPKQGPIANVNGSQTQVLKSESGQWIINDITIDDTYNLFVYYFFAGQLSLNQNLTLSNIFQD